MTNPLDPELAIGVVSLSVGDLNRSIAYYEHHIGLKLFSREGDVATLGVGNLPLLRLHEQPGARVVRRATGLYHFAIRVPTRHDLARVIQHFAEVRTPIGGASDHLVSEALYLSDPDGHGIEVYRDRPRSGWYDAQGAMQMVTEPLDIRSILGELTENEEPWTGLPDGTDMGHIHLQVSNLAEANRFYINGMGFEHMFQMPSASFIATGGYHHHIGMNTWAGVGVPNPPESAARLLSYEILLPSRAALDAVRDNLCVANIPLEEQAEGWAVRDPSNNLVLLRVRN